jgi:hypothetical protein
MKYREKDGRDSRGDYIGYVRVTPESLTRR